MSDENTNKKSFTVQGVEVDVRIPYAAGHVVTEAEASTLNQTFVENIRNNTSTRVKRAIKAWTEAELAEGEEPHTEENFTPSDELLKEIQDYADSYEFGIKRMSNLEPADPVEKEARKIAREKLNAALKNKGIKYTGKDRQVSEEKYESLLASIATGEDVVKEAQRRVKVAKNIGDAELDISGLLDA
jgi:hypothetical protein